MKAVADIVFFVAKVSVKPGYVLKYSLKYEIKSRAKDNNAWSRLPILAP